MSNILCCLEAGWSIKIYKKPRVKVSRVVRMPTKNFLICESGFSFVNFHVQVTYVHLKLGTFIEWDDVLKDK